MGSGLVSEHARPDPSLLAFLFAAPSEARVRTTAETCAFR
jgi:hypothetical protein